MGSIKELTTANRMPSVFVSDPIRCLVPAATTTGTRPFLVQTKSADGAAGSQIKIYIDQAEIEVMESLRGRDVPRIDEEKEMRVRGKVSE